MKLWFLLGVLFLSTAVIGIVLPLLPTTPLVLVAAGCFAKSSPRTYQWLLESERFGPVIKSWENSRCVPLRVKWVAISMIILVGGSSVWFFVPMGWPKVTAVLFLIVGASVILRLNTCPTNA
jgi:uncharacterized membrane protein YbaN (DUF454 family)